MRILDVTNPVVQCYPNPGALAGKKKKERKKKKKKHKERGREQREGDGNIH